MNQTQDLFQQIGGTVCRGAEKVYNFEVFAIDFEFSEISAVFILSHRKLDKNGKGHHKYIYIGQTENLGSELEKCKLNSCIEGHNANVVCILMQSNEQKRIEIEADIKSNYTIPCLN